MPNCAICARETPDGSTFCPGCGARLDAERSSHPSSASASSVDRGAFAAGSVLAGRYRIVGLIGRGGMGEVYEADDLTLGQVVALKFLPSGLAGDEDALRRLRDEVRIARRVSHPNVARVYDIGDVDGHHFLTMEFVRGEDLHQVLKRIGRLPAEKSLEIAHQICDGLAAAHDQGVLHRDLKPANILLDADGKARVIDFGLAVLDSDESAGLAGTPAYMAPEQIRGQAVTVRSEVYSLGLLLFELFTGKPAFTASTFEDFQRLHEQEAPPMPSSIVENVDPETERVILQSLEKDPMRRPPSVRAVSAALPGGDALAAALAAGHTPSPEVVAAAGSADLWRPGVVVGMFVTALLLAAFGAWLSIVRSPMHTEIEANSPDVMTERARRLLATLGYDEHPDYSVGWYRVDDDRRLVFEYRQSPEPIVYQRQLTPTDPPRTVPGMIGVTLSSEGALRALHVVPEPPPSDPPEATEVDWGALLSAAGLVESELEPAAAQYLPSMFCDQRREWTRPDPDDPTVTGRVAAASLHGRPVFFTAKVGTAVSRSPKMSPSLVIGMVLFLIITVIIPLVSVLVAWRNLRLGRGDRRGATRLAVFSFLTLTAQVALSRINLTQFDGLDVAFDSIAGCVAQAMLLWIGYLALEPYVRRKWPHALIPWTRLIARRGHDPLVGESLLVGVLCGMAMICLVGLVNVAPAWIEGVEPPRSFGLGGLYRLRPAIGFIVGMPFQAMILAMICVLTIAFLRRMTGGMAPVLWILVATVMIWAAVPHADSPVLVAGYSLALAVTITVVLLRFGLLAIVAMMMAMGVMAQLPLTLNPSSWFFHNVWLLGAVIVGLAAWGMRAALAGRPLLSAD